MERRDFIKSTGLGLAAFFIVGTVPLEPKPEAIEAKPYHPVMHKVPQWRYSQDNFFICATVYGYDKKTLEIKSIEVTIPEAELKLSGPEYTEVWKEQIIARARQQLIDGGCVPL